MGAHIYLQNSNGGQGAIRSNNEMLQISVQLHNTTD